MVQFQLWNDRVLLTDQGTPFDQHFRWNGQFGGTPAQTRYVWPFPDTEWKGGRIIIYTQNGLSTATITRTLNGLDVGQKLVLGAGDPPSVPTVFIDLGIVAVTTGDLVGYRKSGPSSGSLAEVNFTSYFEFADGLWGF